MTEATVDADLTEYPDKVQEMYDDALVKGNDSVTYEMLLTVAENINETRDDVNVEIHFSDDI